MNHFSYLQQDIDLSNLDKKFYYINPRTIYNTTQDKNKFLDKRSRDFIHDINFGIYTKEYSTCYSRFDLDKSMISNPKYNFLPKSKEYFLPFDTITDERSRHLEIYSKNYDSILVFWSGGIDSTLILSAILKNWSVEELKKIHVVLNKHSIEENQNFYNSKIENKIKIINSDDFFSGRRLINKNEIYVMGDPGDAISSYQNLERFDQMYPGFYKKSWRKNIDVLISYFTHQLFDDSGSFTYKKIVRSLNSNQIETETIFDFLWWIMFNWGYDKTLYNILWQFTPEFNLDVKNFMEKNYFSWFNTIEYQTWSVFAGTDLKICDDIDSIKYSLKKYILEFDKNLEYFKNKKKILSTPQNILAPNHRVLCAIDENYNYYYRYVKEIKWQ